MALSFLASAFAVSVAATFVLITAIVRLLYSSKENFSGPINHALGNALLPLSATNLEPLAKVAINCQLGCRFFSDYQVARRLDFRWAQKSPAL
jgi:hypothetical protein